MYFYHITRMSDWLEAKKEGWYAAESLTSEGFIHCSLKSQVTTTAARYYRDVKGLVLLEIDPERLSSRWIMETSTNGENFPHVYGRINGDAVRRISSLEPLPDGSFLFPQELN